MHDYFRASIELVASLGSRLLRGSSGVGGLTSRARNEDALSHIVPCLLTNGWLGGGWQTVGAGESASLSILFLARQEGVVFGTLVLETSVGGFLIQVSFQKAPEQSIWLQKGGEGGSA